MHTSSSRDKNSIPVDVADEQELKFKSEFLGWNQSSLVCKKDSNQIRSLPCSPSCSNLGQVTVGTESITFHKATSSTYKELRAGPILPIGICSRNSPLT